MRAGLLMPQLLLKGVDSVEKLLTLLRTQGAGATCLHLAPPGNGYVTYDPFKFTGSVILVELTTILGEQKAAVAPWAAAAKQPREILQISDDDDDEEEQEKAERLAKHSRQVANHTSKIGQLTTPASDSMYIIMCEHALQSVQLAKPFQHHQ